MSSRLFRATLACCILAGCTTAQSPEAKRREIRRQFDSINQTLVRQNDSEEARRRDYDHRIDSVLSTIHDPGNPYLDSLKRLRNIH